MMPNRFFTVIGALLVSLSVVCTGCAPSAQYATEKPKPDVSFKPQEVTDALHGVIAADRAMYAQHVLQRAADLGLGESAPQWRENQKSLPLHADMLRLASQAVQKHGAEFHYALRSLQPVNPRNAPQTDTERKGLEFVATNPGRNFYAEESLGGRRYFTAVYPDKANVKVCVDCHNANRGAAPEHQLGSLMGGIVVRVPLEF